MIFTLVKGKSIYHIFGAFRSNLFSFDTFSKFKLNPSSSNFHTQLC